MFSNAYGLEVNKDKSEVYFARMSEQEIHRVTEVSGFNAETLPLDTWGFPYLP